MTKTFDQFLNESETTFNAEQLQAIQKHAEKAQKLYNDTHVGAVNKGVIEYKITIEARPGQKWARIVRSEIHRQTGVEYGRTVLGFAGADGKLYKAASWTQPAKNFARGDWGELESLGGGKWSNGQIC